MSSCGDLSSGAENTPVVDTTTAQGKIDNSVLQYPSKNNFFRYNVYTHYVSISQCISTEPDIVIPDTIEQLPVLVIEDKAFQSNYTIKTISLGKNIVKIGESAFSDCKILESVIFPSTLSLIGKNAFKNCESLKSVIIPNGVTIIPANCFVNCKSLKSVTIESAHDDNEDVVYNSENGRTISSNAFANCPALSYAWIPNDVAVIDKSAFKKSTATLTIYGYAASQAAIFGAANLIDFVVLDKSQFLDLVNSNLNNYQGVGQSIQTDVFKVTFNNVEQTTVIGNQHAGEKNTYIIFNFTVENLSDKPAYFNSLFVTGASGDVTKYPVYFAEGAYKQPLLAGMVTNTAPINGYVAFEVSQSATHVLIDFNDVANFNTVDSIMVAFLS